MFPQFVNSNPPSPIHFLFPFYACTYNVTYIALPLLEFFVCLAFPLLCQQLEVYALILYGIEIYMYLI